MNLNKYKICPECGKQNTPSLIECRYCEADLTGVKIVDDSTAETDKNIQSSVVSKNKAPIFVRKCECGAENAPQARKCGICGEDISDILPIQKEETDEPKLLFFLESCDGTFSFEINKPAVVIGREAELNDYLHDKIYVSRQHARISVADGNMFVENLSRTNKTFVNNIEIQDSPTVLADGDEIGLGGKLIDGQRQDKAAYFIIRVRS